MKKYNLIKLLFLLIPVFQGFSQEKVTISGFLKDADTGEGLIGSTIYVEELRSGTTTNLYGFYSVTLPKGDYNLRYSYVGYKSITIPVELSEDVNNDVEMHMKSTQIDEVVILSEGADKNVRKAEMGVMKLSPKEAKMIPVLLGEQDILKTIQLLPGVSSGTEGTTGFYVRGGGVDQNLIILDEATVYSASHLMGFFSVFNSDAIKDVELYKGNAPANYGGRLSSILDIQMNDGNYKKFTASGGLGLLSSRLTLQAPIVKDKSSFIISGRRSYADIFTVFSRSRTQKNTDLYFYDLNAKANYRIDNNNRIFLSGYFGRDVFNIHDLFALKWGNQTGTLRWNHVFNNKLFSNSSLIYSNYNYGFGYNFSDNMIYINSGIRDMNVKEDFQCYINTDNTLKFGFNAIHHTYRPGEIDAGNNDLFNSVFMGRKQAYEGAAYVSHELSISDHINITYGLRYSGLASVGPDTVYTYNERDEITSAEAYSKGDIIQLYSNLEPRATFNFRLNTRNSVKLSYSRNAQYVHLLSNSSASLPTDVWIPSSKNVKPQIADQFALGFFRNFKDNMFETSVEVYYKNLKNQIDYQNGAELLLNKNVESQLIFGKGRAYGLELFVKKRTGKLTGWIGYTLSRTEKSMDAIDNGEWYPAKYDRTHDISIVGMYQLNKKWNMSATWVFNTGNAVTFPSGKYQVDEFTVPVYTKRNAYRMPDYHRMDIGATYIPKKKKRFESSWNFSVYNVYGRKNAFSITFRENESNPNQTEAFRLSLFQMIPSVTYNFKF
ncbi:carboxypeptidase-like regulatory domain-containing protein [Saccharicrinis sp. FJH62]|uniref:TonB-dependent receptor n=1 Tax=Saccharicrinis sp. FJH62 TaxID=3344657 RepID=UPI0035D42137